MFLNSRIRNKSKLDNVNVLKQAIDVKLYITSLFVKHVGCCKWR